jgi:exopolysaccharide biosynthesis polyprenyl glycosylphosphotransferase
VDNVRISYQALLQAAERITKRGKNGVSQPVSNILRPNGNARPALDRSKPLDELSESTILAQDQFMRKLCLERKRTERSRRHFVLMLLECQASNREEALEKVWRALLPSTRETDIKGWYQDGAIVGVIFTEIGAAEGTSVANALLTRVTHALSNTLSIEQLNEIKISFRIFPDEWSKTKPGSPADYTLYPDLMQDIDRQNISRSLKRSIDIAGSLFALLLFAPLLIVISVAVKLTSRGPVFFRQARVGQYGKMFTFLKFRSMSFSNDHTIHKEYIRHLISGTARPAEAKESQRKVYKLTADPRITPVGRLLRRTSLDELPQLFNVLRGEMSLVGPRPPIPYELDYYDIWHKHRLLPVKPGITGLWQVEGRSRVSFDEMVRLDLKYARSWSLWLDLKILLRTPQAVVFGEGAY